VHLRWEYVALVLVGGSIGTAGRYLLTSVLPSWHDVPVGTLVANVTGAFLLGLLLEALVRRGPDQGSRRVVRLLVGTGVLGGFTTYSSFAVETDGLLRAADVAPALIYAAATLVLGLVATSAGIVVGARSSRPGGHG